jgi:hypothetical protein
MKNDILERLYWAFWCSTTILTGILAGFLASHAIMLGRFFNWYIDSGNVELLHRTFTVFRKAAGPQVLYYIPLYLALVSGIVWAMLAFAAKRHRLIAAIAGLSTLWVGIVFYLSKLGQAEAAVLSGTADADMMRLYVSINLPIHALFAVFYTVSLFLLLRVAPSRP